MSSDGLGLGNLVVEVADLRLRARPALRHETTRVIACLDEDRVGEGDDRLGAAVVAHEPHLSGAGKAAREVAQEPVGRAREGVDRLRRVAHDADVLPVAEPEVEKAVLQGTDVLELVDGEPPVGGADLVEDVGALPQQADRHEQDVVEVHDTPVGLDFVVLGIDTSDVRRGQGRGALRCLLRVALGIDPHLLGPGDLGDEVAHGGGVGRDGTPRRRLGDEWRDLGDDVVRLPADGTRPEVTELAQGGRVEGPHLHALDAEPEQSLAHLAGSAGGEGDREPSPRVMRAGARGMRDSVGDSAGLAGACARPDDDGALHGLRHGALLRVKRVEQVGVHGGIVALGSDDGRPTLPRRPGRGRIGACPPLPRLSRCTRPSGAASASA